MQKTTYKSPLRRDNGLTEIALIIIICAMAIYGGELRYQNNVLRNTIQAQADYYENVLCVNQKLQ